MVGSPATLFSWIKSKFVAWITPWVVGAHPSVESLPMGKTYPSDNRNVVDKKDEEKEQNLYPGWQSYKDVLIHKQLFDVGIVAVKPNGLEQEPMVKADEFTLTSRKLRITSAAEFLKDDMLKSHTAPLLKARALLKSLKPPMLADNNDEKETVIYNPERRDEVFLPFIFQDTQQQKTGFYIYPWLSKGSTLQKFTRFKRFLMAGCMFGPNLKGVDQFGGSFPLIKHDIKFLPTQKIKSIDYNPAAANPYEEMLFSEFEGYANFIDVTAETGKKSLYYHLPYYDYMLFGVELFIRGRITLAALDNFFITVLQKKKEHVKRILEICNSHHIHVKIESPFENLFGHLHLDQQEIARRFLQELGLSVEEIDPELDPDRKKLNENALVQLCLARLQQNTFCQEQQQIWKAFYDVSDKMEVNNLEELFKIANAVMLAVGARGVEDYDTCSLLPLSEKQIQFSYAKYSKQLNGKYPAIFNATVLDPILSYDRQPLGALFYFGSCQYSLAKLINKKGILAHAHRNIACYYQKSQQPEKVSVDLQTVLKK